MLTDGNVFQQQWSMAKVIAVYPGKDGVVRAVDVQVETAILPKNYDTKLQLAQTIKTRTAVYTGFDTGFFARGGKPYF